MPLSKIVSNSLNSPLTVGNLTSTGVYTFSAGTVSAPAITTTGDTNTGIFFPAADTIAFTEGGVESVRIDSSGNVGIGTSSPTKKLFIADSSFGAVGIYRDLDVTSVGAAGQFIELGARNGATFTPGAAVVGALENPATTGFLRFDIRSSNTLTERMRIDSAGNVGIGTSSPASKLDIAQNTAADVQLKITNQNSGSAFASNIKLQADNATGSRFNAIQSFSGGTAQWQIGGGGSDSTIAFSIGSSLTERMRIDSSVLSLTGLQGIKFQATQSASSDANTLDDYEEGTWTPTASPGAGSITSFTSSGLYTKIGRVVTLNARVSITNGGTASGILNIGGFPFTSINFENSVYRTGIGIVRENGLTGNYYGIYTTSNTTSGVVEQIAVPVSYTTNAAYIFTLVYFT